MLPPPQVEMEAAFHLLDMDGNGHVDVEEARKLLTTAGAEVSVAKSHSSVVTAGFVHRLYKHR